MLRKITIIVLLFVLLFNGCKNRQKETHTIFTYNESSNITSLDPAYARSLANIWAVNQIFNGLVQLDTSLQITPCIAKSWEISDDGLTYTFYLRQDVFFHENKFLKSRRVVASDFVYSFNRVIDPKTASPGSWIFQNVKRLENGQPCFFAVNDSTLKIELKQPFPPFLGLLTTPYCFVVMPEAVEFFGNNFRSNPIGAGPFKFAYWKENVKLVLLKNENYFEKDQRGNKLPYLDAINITFVVDKQTVLMNFIKGNIDFISGIDGSYKDALLNKDGSLKEKFKSKFYIQTRPFYNTEYLGFLLDKNSSGFKNILVDDVRIRQAINYCFDRKKMIKYLRNNIGTPGINGMVPPFMIGFSNKVKGYDYNPEKAKQLLKEAGYYKISNPQPIELTTTAAYLDFCQYIQHEAKKIGIEIKIDVTQPATLREMVAKSQLQFFRASWIADYPDAETYLSLFYSKNFSPDGPNYTHFSNKEYDAIYEKAITIANDSTRWEMYHKLDSIIVANAPVVVLYYDQMIHFIRKNVTNVYANPMNSLILKYAKKNSENTF